MKVKLIKILALIVILFTVSSFKNTKTDYKSGTRISAEKREFYQLKTYIFKTEKQVETTDKYLKEAYLPALKKLGFKNIGVFKPRLTATDTIRKIIVLIPFPSMNQFLDIDAKLAKDKIYLTAGQDYLNSSFDNIPYLRIESVILKAFTDMPVMKASALEGPRANRVYELRSYESPTEAYFNNKLHMFNAGGEIKLFERLNFNAVLYGEVISGAKMPNLMYITTFSDQASRDEHWKEFVDSPEWKDMSTMPKYQKNVSHSDITFLYPTEYSDY